MKALVNLPLSGTTANGPLATLPAVPRPLPMASPRPRPARLLNTFPFPRDLASVAAAAAILSRSWSANAFSSLAERRIFFGLNLLSLARPLEPPLVVGSPEPPVGCICTVGGGRMGVDAGVSVGCVAGESLGSTSIGSTSS